MKKLLTATLLFIAVLQAKAQYYYLDIIGTDQTNTQHQKLRLGNFKQITAASYEANNQPINDFKLDQVISNNGLQVTTHSTTVNSVEAFFTSFYSSSNKLIKTVDSSSNAINTVVYEYDDKGKLLFTKSSSTDFDGTYSSTETHSWTYAPNGQPASMLKIKNGKDSLLVTFKSDEAGNVAEENWVKNKRTIETYYYYYNSTNKLTDIVRYNRKAKQMLPDFMFEYDIAGLVSQMTQTQGSSANYLIWRYVYNNKGLKDKEFVFNKQKQLLGKIEYAYQ